MCGILLLNISSPDTLLLLPGLQKGIRSRGPDLQNDGCLILRRRQVGIEPSAYVLCATVLHIQGSQACAQPYICPAGNILGYNGEIFGGVDCPAGVSDTPTFCSLISTAVDRACHEYATSDLPSILTAVSTKLSEVQGPYAFVFYSKPLGCIIYGRDPFGRRSLLALKKKGKLLALASVFACSLEADMQLDEIFVGGVYGFSIHDCDAHSFSPWPAGSVRLGDRTLQDTCTIISSSTPSPPSIITSPEDCSSRFLAILQKAVLRRVEKHSTCPDTSLKPQLTKNPKECRVGVLFSGGIDSVLLAALLHLCLPSDDVIDLLNVTFDGYSPGVQSSTNKDLSISSSSNCSSSSTSDLLDSIRNVIHALPATHLESITPLNFDSSKIDDSLSDESDWMTADPSPDRLAAEAALVELRSLYPHRCWRLVYIDISAEERARNEGKIRELIQPLQTHMDLNIGTAFWFASRGAGYLREYDRSVELFYAINDASTGRPLLRRGGEGADRAVGRKSSTIKILPSNVSDRCGNTQDECRRKVKKECVRGMCKRCCFKFKETACALSLCPVHKDKKGFFPQGEEKEKANPFVNLLEVRDAHDKDRVLYKTTCKAVLIGIGADEQLAGYGRHRTVFKAGGKQALVSELNKDTQRLWKRNLGRDDRCVSDNGREGWFPFLDEELVEFLNGLDIADIADLSSEEGHGDKRILRSAARLLGLSECTYLVKRAIQFGTRIAKHTNVMYHGSNRKGSGDSLLSNGDGGEGEQDRQASEQSLTG